MSEDHELRDRLMRLLLIGSLGALAIQLALRYRASQPAPAVQVATYAAGDTLPNVPLTVYSAPPNTGSPSQETSSLQDLLKPGCALLAFFDSECPICQQIAERWYGVRTVAVGTDTVPVRWVGVRVSDTGAVRFIAEYDLADRWFMLPTAKAVGDLGVPGTPLVYVVDQKRVYHGTTSRSPANIKSLPEACLSRREGSPAIVEGGPGEK